MMTIKSLFMRVGLLLAAVAAPCIAAAGDAPPLEPLAARYAEIRRDADGHSVANDWFFRRDHASVETGGSEYAEIWQRDDREEVTLQRVFAREGKRIAYTTGELRTQGRLKAWRDLGTIVDAELLAALKRVGSTRFRGWPAERYAGRFGTLRVEVTWLPRQQLPAEVVRRSAGASERLVLRELRAVAPPEWPRIDHAALDDYEFFDASDLGDREYDPFVRRVLAQDAGGAPHAH